MKKLGERNYLLIKKGAKAIGSFNPNEIFYIFEEELYSHQANEIREFLTWMHESGTKLGSGNYEEVFAEWKNIGKCNETLEVIFNVDSHTNTIYAHIISESIATSAPIFTQNLGLQIVTPLEAESMGKPATPQQYEGLKLYMEKKGFTIKVLNDPPHIRDFDSWQETHFEVVHAISAIISTDSYSNRIKQVQEDGGYGALYELAKTLTDQFQDDNEGRAWDGEFFDEIEEYLTEELK